MKLLKRIGGGLFALILAAVLAGILFPKFWLKHLQPVKFEIRKVNMSINPEFIQLDFKLILTRDYLINFALDSLAYDIYFDSLKFSHGGANIKRQMDDGESDTLQLPLKIERGVLKKKRGNRPGNEMVELRIVLHPYLDLPVAGKADFTKEITRQIHAPQPPTFSVINVENNIEGINDATVHIDFELTNPNNYEFNIERIEALLDFHDLFIGRARTEENIHVPANGSVEFGALVEIDNLELVRDGFRIVFRPNKSWPYTVTAKLYIDQNSDEPMLLEIEHSDAMSIMERRKEHKKSR